MPNNYNVICVNDPLAEAARGSWLAVVSGVQSTESGAAPSPSADGYSPMTAYNTTAES